MTDKSYFLKRGKTILGPFTHDRICELQQSGKLRPDDMISTAKNGPWQDATIPEAEADPAGTQLPVAEEIPQVTIAKPPRPHQPPLALEEAEIVTNFTFDAKNRQSSKKGKRGGVVVIIVGIILIALLPILFSSNGQTGNSAGSGNSTLKNITRQLNLNQAERDQLDADIERIESNLRIAEISTDTVFQQQVSHVDACIEMTAVVAELLGATDQQTGEILTELDKNDIFADTVYQQLASHIAVYFKLLTLACEHAGASESEISMVKTSVELDDDLSDTVQQQISARIQGTLKMSELLAKSLGYDRQRLTEVSTSVSLNDSLSETVFQQMSARQAGVVRMLGAAAIAVGADESTISNISNSLESDDLRVKTVQQQLAARLKRSFEMTIELARAIVMK